MVRSFARWVARRTWFLALVAAVVASGCTSSTSCPAGQTSCSGACVDLTSSTLHCGACNVQCNSGALCTAGLCSCPASRPDTCGLECVNLATDTANCGTCGRACGLGNCTAGSCACNPPPPPTALCPDDPATGTCVNTDTSGANCGGCGIVCTPAKVCSGGVCTCLPPNTTCFPGTPAEVCTNTQTDPENCGTCGTLCAAGYTCSAGACRLACPTGLVECNGRCVDTRIDPLNCGSCGRVCSAGQSCTGGACQATCTTLTCGGSCCEAPVAGNACCDTVGSATCPYLHKNFVGTADVQTFYTCTPTGTYDVVTATYASGVWANDFNPPVATRRACPDVGGSLCVVRQKGFGVTAACGVWCYDGPLSGTLRVNPGYACPCPTEQRIDWF